MNSALHRPAPDEYAPFYAGYVERAPDTGLLDFLTAQKHEMRKLLESLSDERASFRYAPDKWSVKGVVGHLTDAERIFSYRALRIARGDETPLPSWDQDRYAVTANFDSQPVAALLSEWTGAREATLGLFRSFDDDFWARRGTASGKVVTVRALAYITAGHADHHIAVLRERYGVGSQTAGTV